jgi:pullulanase-type alpha-1,6-glucosidase
MACQKADNPVQKLVNPQLTIENHAAHWLTQEFILVAKQYSIGSLYLVNKSQPTSYFQLSPSPLPKAISTDYPHLSQYVSYSVELSADEIKALLKQPLFIAQKSEDNTFINGTYLQTASVIDALYTSGDNDANEVTDLGATINGNSLNHLAERSEKNVEFKLWAPTALSVEVLLFEQDKLPTTPSSLVMTEDSHTGIWHVKADKSLAGKYYRYQIKVYHPASQKIETLITTDPYSLSLSVNSEYSQIVDLNDEATLPHGWFSQQDNKVAQPEDNIFYETHIRDFSAADKQLAEQANRGKYLAFTEHNSDGINHLKQLKGAGINSIHLLPAFDIGTVNENSEQVIDSNDPLSKVCQLVDITDLCRKDLNMSILLKDYLEMLPKEDESRQTIVSALREKDNYNWGYDPFHYTVPEGSYAINPEGKSRIVEFRTMVQSLHNMGFRVIMDVVYNHTHQAGLDPTAVLDKIVPNYYHRLDPFTGEISQSTCCDNTATERAMMEKLMVDSLVIWARDYKIDGFRFDLMAHQPKAAMLRARKAVKQVDNDTYFYGEGWNFGEVANNQRFVQASQLALAGSEIGTFTDRLRDAVRGGAFTAQGSDIRKSQGIGNGLATINNELQSNNIQQYLTKADQLRIGLTGNLANFTLKTYNGNEQLGKEIAYGDQPAGYALDPADTINYVSKHDNQTLWDNNQYRIAYHLSTENRVRMQNQSLSFVLFAQGIPFIHMGSELLRSKGFLRDSYDYGDWFNKVDFSQQSNNYDIGLPPADKDQANWSIITDIINKNEGRDKVTAEHITLSNAVFIEQVKIRMSSPLFRLNNQDDIINKVKFHNTGPDQKMGIIVMSIEGDVNTPSQLIIFNTSAQTEIISFTQAEQYQLHPILQQSADAQVRTSHVIQNAFVVPALTTAVFIERLIDNKGH